MLKPYRYKRSGLFGAELPPAPLQALEENEGLSGKVLGQPASDLEERFARALSKNRRVLGYRFQVSFIASRGLPGEKRVDFVVNTGLQRPVEVDGAYVHKTAAQQASDAVKELVLNAYFRAAGYQPLLRIPGFHLENQESADRFVQALF